ncbi:hypothetical protein B0H19DRAFT_1116226 [Mycena capillaripes]|nr:hypothetical protein B0H19DRAFT_1116226 [Mycena capillaripes]
MTTPAQTVADAPSPFDDPSGDIIIRSSENVDFRMHKVLLSLVSPFFKDMFEVPQPTFDGEEKEKFQSDNIRDGIPVISMYDDQNRACGKEVVEFVLSSCHPARFHCRPIAPIRTEMVQPIIDVANRYGMDWAVKAVLHDPHLLKTNPFLVFAHATHKGFAADAALAANETLRFRIQEFPHEPALKYISAYQYHALLEFHKRCGKAAAAIARGEDIDWIPDDTLRLFPGSHVSCSPMNDTENQVNRWNLKLGLDAFILEISMPEPFRGSLRSTSKLRSGSKNIRSSTSQLWWIEYMELTAAAVESRPHSSTVNDPMRIDVALKKAASCTTCASQAYSLMATFIHSFERKIDDVVRKIVDESVFI